MKGFFFASIDLFCGAVSTIRSVFFLGLLTKEKLNFRCSVESHLNVINILRKTKKKNYHFTSFGTLHTYVLENWIPSTKPTKKKTKTEKLSIAISVQTICWVQSAKWNIGRSLVLSINFLSHFLLSSGKQISHLQTQTVMNTKEWRGKWKPDRNAQQKCIYLFYCWCGVVSFPIYILSKT